MEYYYVTRKNNKDNSEELLGFNLTEEQKDKLFYSFKTPSNGNSSNSWEDDGLKNAYGCHKVLFKNEKQAIKELITKPKEFNDALKVINKYGLIAVPKNSVAVSYQQLNKDIF